MLLSTSQAPTPSGQQLSSGPNVSIFIDTLLFARRYNELPRLSNLIKQIFFSHIRIQDFIPLLVGRHSKSANRHEPTLPDLGKKHQTDSSLDYKYTSPKHQFASFFLKSNIH